jgi:hypothetical protein
MMNKQKNSNLTFVQFLLKAQYLAQEEARSDKGYAMMMTSIISIVMLSTLAAYMTMTNLSKSSTNAYVDGTNTFYAAESGLNKRADQLRRTFEVSQLPTSGTSSTASPANVSNCFSIVLADTSNGTTPTGNDFECRNYRFKYGNNSATVKSLGSDNSFGGSTEVTNKIDTISYIAYTSVVPKQNYSTTPATSQLIPSGEPFAGLYVTEYKYTVSATAKKINSNGSSEGTANTVLQLDFKSRVVPLFQFAAFYENDLEMNAITPMSVTGPVHTNSNLRAVSLNTSASTTNVTAGTTLMDKVTAALDVHNRLLFGSNCGLTEDCGVVGIYKGSGNEASGTNYTFFPGFRTNSILTATELAAFGDRLKSRVPRLNPPTPGFLREKNYFNNKTGLYYGKADMRLKFFPDRAMPFNFTSIQDGSGCNLTTYKIPSDRQHSDALKCTKFTKGMLNSLMQPVLTQSTSTTALTAKNKNILKALRVALASSPTPIKLVDLKNLIVTTIGWGKIFKEQLALELETGGALTPTEISALLPTSAPVPAPAAIPTPPTTCTAATSWPTTGKATEIVNALCSKLLPAPIQTITSTTNSNTGAVINQNLNVGFYNQIQSGNNVFSISNGQWMKMLQLNVESLTYWNRDGIYVEADAANTDNLTVAYAAPTTLTASSGISTDDLAFIKAAADTTKPVSSFAYQGLAANDVGTNATEGGLVFYANVSDDTNGDDTADITAPDTNNPVPGKDASGNTIARVDNYRSYPGFTGIRKSPYAFVISGGVELPGPLTIATDQAAYIQGDYNNPGVIPGSLSQGTFYDPSNVATNDQGYRRQPAAIMADTITFLSNQCLNNNRQVNCGHKITSAASLPVVTNGMAINAALLSNTMNTTGSVYSGGLNKYMKHLENWGQAATLNYTGSMVSLGEPLESDLFSVNDTSVYKRNYSYETRFNSFDKLPPLSPSAVYLRQDVFRKY